MQIDKWLDLRVGFSPDFMEQISEESLSGHCPTECADDCCPCHASFLTLTTAISLGNITKSEWCVGCSPFPVPPGARWWQRVFWRWLGPDILQNTGVLNQTIQNLARPKAEQGDPYNRTVEQLLQRLASQVHYGVSIGPLTGTSAHDYVRKLGERLGTELQEFLGDKLKPPFPLEEEGNREKFDEAIAKWIHRRDGEGDYNGPDLVEIVEQFIVRCRVKISQIGSIRSIFKYYFPPDAAERKRLPSLLESENRILMQIQSIYAQPSAWAESVARQLTELAHLMNRVQSLPPKKGTSETLAEEMGQRTLLLANPNPQPPDSEATDNDTENKPRAILKRPPDKAFQAWQIRELVGISKQGDIAEMMTTQGVSATQGQVSKWLAAVEEWRQAGGLMPDVGTLENEPQSVDPDILDMGARRDGRTPRQRDRRDRDADE